jgi:hypothetical protein
MSLALMTISGLDAAAAVVNDHTGPDVVPAPLRATICQKYFLLVSSVDGEYEAPGWEDDTTGGGFVVPNFTS